MKKNNFLKAIFFVVDLFLITLAFILAWKIRFFNDVLFLDLIPKLSFNFQFDKIFSFNGPLNGYEGLFIFIIVMWSTLIYVLDLLHVPRTVERIKSTFWNYIFYPQSILISSLFIWIIFFNYDDIPRLFLIVFLCIQTLFLILSKKIRSEVYKYLRISGYDLIGLGIISDDKNIDIINESLFKQTKKGFYFKNLQLKDIYIKSKNDCNDLLDFLNHGDYMLLDTNHLSKKDIIQITESAEDKGIYIFHILSENKYNILKDKGINIYNFGSLNTIKSIRLTVKNPISIINKRIFDFLFSLTFILTIYWWVYLVVSLLIKIQSKGPVLFKQERVGLDGNIFVCYKFRTMHLDETNSKDITKVGDQRIFGVGRFMRKVNIDEFPQFINVFNGDMSVVGPRPHMVSEDKMLSEKISKYRMRRWVKPGITGYAAMKGFRGGTESLDLMQQRINLDVEYIEKWSFLLDIKICIDTVLEIIFLKKKGY
tara:strand:- start:986 stop:2428 length:1443 start_codon:yes stop_codon:yes gene_type:complete